MARRRRLETEANAGNPDAQYSLAAAYATGEGLELSLSKAVEWYTRAGEQGHAEALYNLGFMQILGEGTEKNVEIGTKTMTRAAALGSRDAMRFLADSLAEGRLVLCQEDLSAAYYYIRGLAAGDIHSPVSLAIAMKAGKIRSKEVVAALLKFAAENGSSEARELQRKQEL